MLTGCIAGTNIHLFFKGPYHHPSDKIFLDKGVQNHHGERADYQNRVPELVHQIKALGNLVRIHPGQLLLGHIHDKKNVPQNLLKIEHARIRQIEKAAEITVPDAHSVEQDHDGYNRHRKGQGKLEKKLKVPAAVYVGRVQKTIGKGGLKISFYDNHIITRESRAYDQGQPGTYQVEVPHKQITWDKTAAEKHGNHKQSLEQFTVREITPGQGVRRQKYQGNRHNGTAGHIKQGIEKTGYYKGMFKNPLISVQ
jgi:hypothetical protein